MAKSKSRVQRKRAQTTSVVIGSSRQARITSHNIPVAIGRVIPAPRHAISSYRGGAVDCNPMGAITISGHSRLTNLRYGLTGNGILSYPAGGNGNYYAAVTPANFSDSLQLLYALFDVYGFYRWRKLRVHFVPVLNTDAIGQMGFALRTVSLTSASFEEDTGYPQIINNIVSVSTSPYQPASLPEYNYNGPRIFNCNTPIGVQQLYLEGATDGTVTVGPDEVAADTSMGNLFFEYEIDLFEPKSNVGTPSITLNRFVSTLSTQLASEVNPLVEGIRTAIQKDSQASASSSSRPSRPVLRQEPPDVSGWHSVSSSPSRAAFQSPAPLAQPKR